MVGRLCRAVGDGNMSYAVGLRLAENDLLVRSGRESNNFKVRQMLSAEMIDNRERVHANRTGRSKHD